MAKVIPLLFNKYLTISCNTSLEWIAPGTQETTHAAPSILSLSKMMSSTSVVLPDCGGPCTRIDWGQQEEGHEATRREREAEAESAEAEAGAEHIVRQPDPAECKCLLDLCSCARVSCSCLSLSLSRVPAVPFLPAFLLILTFQDVCIIFSEIFCIQWR